MATHDDNHFDKQWYLINGDISKYDLNVADVWDEYTGKDVKVVVMETGIDYLHPDLAPNYDSALQANFRDSNSDDPYQIGDPGDHGTATGGIIAASAEGRTGTVGIAHEATLSAYRARHSHVDEGMKKAVADGIDVVNMSKGGGVGDMFEWDDEQKDGLPALETALATGRQHGFDHLGVNFIKSAGNDRRDGEDSAADAIESHRGSIVVASVDSEGEISSSSTPGANLLVSAFGRDGIYTTDVSGDTGYSTTDYTDDFGGTSAAAPQVAGVVALMLEANEALGWRDVQSILANSARHVGSNVGDAAEGAEIATWGAPSWMWNDADNWNGGGMHFSNDYGYGLVDAKAAVRMAETWTTQNISANEDTTTLDFDLDAPARARSTREDVPVRATVTATEDEEITIEYVDVTIDFEATSMDKVWLYLTSPEGTKIRLFGEDGNTDSFDGSWTFGTNGLRGEETDGEWTLVATTTDYQTVEIRDVTITAYGDADTDRDDVFIYTDEYSKFADKDGHSTSIDGHGGDNMLNAAAVDSASVIDLANDTGVIDGVRTQIREIDRVYTGDGNDSITGDSVSDYIWTGRGNDTVDGGSKAEEIEGRQGRDDLGGGGGNDTIHGGEGDDTLDGDGDHDQLYGDDGADRLDGGTGNDTLYGGKDADTLNGEAGHDLLFGSHGTDSLTGGTGNDTMRGGDHADTLNGQGDNDRLFGEDGADRLDGGDGNDSLYGGKDGDTLNGDGDHDHLYGDGGADRIDGGGGNDWIDGGGDRFNHLNGGDGYDTLDARGYDEGYTFFMSSGTDRNVNHSVVNFEAVLTGIGDDAVYGNSADNDIQTGEGNDTVFGSSGADTIKTGDQNDYIDGGTEADTIDAGWGDDTVKGGDHDDRIQGGRGRDEMDGGSGYDTLVTTEFNGTYEVDLNTGVTNWARETAINFEAVETGNGNDRITGTAGANHIETNGGHDRISAGSGNDTILGGEGNDIIDGGWGFDDADGGGGIDTMDGRFYNGAWNFDMGTGVIDWGYTTERAVNFEVALTGNGNDRVAGTGTADRIETAGGADTLLGGDGHDTLLAGSGNDTVRGGEGNDVIDGGWGFDDLDGGAGFDVMDGSFYNGAWDFDMASGVVDWGSVTERAVNFEQAITGNGNDRVAGTNGNDVIESNGGNDRIEARGGHDHIVSGQGRDDIDAGAGNDVVESLLDGDTIEGGAGFDTLITTGTNNNVTFSMIDDWLRVDPISGNMDVFNFEAAETGGGNDWVGGTDEANEIVTNGGNDTLEGGLGDDILKGGADSDDLQGGGDDDRLDGGSEADRLTGGHGDDELTGGAGADTFIFHSFGDGHDRITDFEMGVDTLDLRETGITNVLGLNYRQEAEGLKMWFGETVIDFEEIEVENLHGMDILFA